MQGPGTRALRRLGLQGRVEGGARGSRRSGQDRRQSPGEKTCAVREGRASSGLLPPPGLLRPYYVRACAGPGAQW